ncbi:hypothetical protein N2152v2_008303 [Parachlorella kessleri]
MPVNKDVDPAVSLGRLEGELLQHRLGAVTEELGRVKAELEEALDLSSELSYWLLRGPVVQPITAAPPATPPALQQHQAAGVAAVSLLPAQHAAAQPEGAEGHEGELGEACDDELLHWLLSTPVEHNPAALQQPRVDLRQQAEDGPQYAAIGSAGAQPLAKGPRQFGNATFHLQLENLFSTWADKPKVAAGKTVGLASVALLPATAVAILAFATLVGWRVFLRRLHKIEQALQRQLEATEAKLQATTFAKENAEQSVQLLEQELRRKVDQESMQQHKSHTASPLSVASDPCTPFGPTAPLYTPGRGELPPPPAQLVEKFLKDRHAVAVEEAQVQEWLLMEEEHVRLRDELAALVEQRANMEASYQMLTDKPRQKSQAEHTQHLKEWLEVAQEELLTTQSQLQESEAEVRRLAGQLEAARTQGAGSNGQEQGNANMAAAVAAKEQSLLEQNLTLVAELQRVTAAFETLQAQFSSTQQALAVREAESRRAAVEPSSPLGERHAQVTGTPAITVCPSPGGELSSEVDSMLELMRATRHSLADRLNRSQEVCAQTISGLTRLAKVEGSTCAASSTKRTAPVRISTSPASSDHSHQGSPASLENLPLGKSNRQNAPVPTNFSFAPTIPAKRTPPRRLPASLGNENASPAGKVVLWGIGGVKDEGSLRKTREAAKQQVHAIRAQYSSFELGAFLHRMGCLAVAPAAGVGSRADFERLKDEGVAALSSKATQGMITVAAVSTLQARQPMSGLWQEKRCKC